MATLDQRDYYLKKDSVLAKFREEFVKGNYQTDPIFHSIIENLIRDASPYEIIERLIVDRQKLVADMQIFMENHAAPQGIKFPY